MIDEIAERGLEPWIVGLLPNDAMSPQPVQRMVPIGAYDRYIRTGFQDRSLISDSEYYRKLII